MNDGRIEMNNRDILVLKGWMTRLLVNDSNEMNHKRLLTATELLVFAKLYGFVQDDQGIAHCTLDYLAKWTGASIHTVSDCINLFIKNNFLRVEKKINKFSNKVMNVYYIDKINYDNNDSNYIVKNNSSTVILPFMLDLGIKSYTLILYSIIHNYSSDGLSECKASDEYLRAWCSQISVKTLKRCMETLTTNNLITISDSSSYLKTYRSSKTFPLDSDKDPELKMNDGRTKMNDGRTKMNDGQTKMNDGRTKMNDGRTKMNDGMDKNERLNLSINSSLNKAVVSNNTAALSQEIIDLFQESSLSGIISEDSFKKRLSNWVNTHQEINDLIPAYIKNTLERYEAKKSSSPGLFITMFESNYDLLNFLNYQSEHKKTVSTNTLACPICNTDNSVFDYCSCCNFDMSRIKDEDYVAFYQKYYVLNDSIKNIYDQKIIKIMQKSEYSGMNCIKDRSLLLKRESEITSVKKEYGLIN